MKKKYPKTKELINKLLPYWKEYLRSEGKFYDSLNSLETKMEKELSIKGIEFFFCDNECVGIGNANRTMELIQREDLEDEEKS